MGKGVLFVEGFGGGTKKTRTRGEGGGGTDHLEKKVKTNRFVLADSAEKKEPKEKPGPAGGQKGGL